ncbi:ferric-chelate reductase [Fusarium beomiforme]|uniref:Ferric-chelate reductase n=1 Tax=Fusarium beomiforme TaxID=44412 RepID=A0A9P5AHM1_9HYPO|nr:ferric-chelate reductase [Fusarium beomiforme]
MTDPVITDRYTAARAYFGAVIGLILLDALLPSIIYAFQKYNKYRRQDRNVLHWSITVWFHKLHTAPLPLPYLDWHVTDAARFTAFLVLNLIFGIQSNEFTADYTLYGWLAIANAGLALLMASRNNLFGTLLRIPSPVLLQYHRWIGLATVAHTTAHVSFNIQHYIETKQVTTSFANHRIQVGLMAWIALVVLFLTALPIVRRRFFEVFYYTHALFFVFVVGALIHASHGPEFMLPGLLLWGADRAIRFAYNFRRIQVQSVETFEGSVTKFKVKGLQTRQPGQVVWLQLPGVSLVNWHPFTVASAPNDPEKTATIAVRGLGGFTKAVQYADCNGDADQRGCASLDSNSMMTHPLKMRLDGPYGVGSVSWGLLPVTVLIAGGVGITPGISIASHVIRQASAIAGSGSTAHVHLLWVVKDSQHIQWFAEELSELAKGCAKLGSPATLDISIFVTGGAVQRNEGSHEMQDTNSLEPWSMHSGRPDLKQWFGQLKSKHLEPPKEQRFVESAAGGEHYSSQFVHSRALFLPGRLTAEAFEARAQRLRLNILPPHARRASFATAAAFFKREKIKNFAPVSRSNPIIQILIIAKDVSNTTNSNFYPPADIVDLGRQGLISPVRKDGTRFIHKRRIINDLGLTDIPLEARFDSTPEAFHAIPDQRVSKATLKHIGFTEEKAEEIWHQFENFPVIDFPDKI